MRPMPRSTTLSVGLSVASWPVIAPSHNLIPIWERLKLEPFTTINASSQCWYAISESDVCGALKAYKRVGGYEYTTGFLNSIE